ncbi:hypothetical protein KSF73_07740 [Burkholderiaceae bacterium DAT-1]|nr:hypothetical protein [Burkholderiaceae bacterium DAT-1]
MSSSDQVLRKWDDQDIGSLKWHDVYIRGMAFFGETCELRLDIDYILEWIAPAPGETYFSFRLAPATVVFADVTDMKMSTDSFGAWIQIDTLTRNKLNETPREGGERFAYCFECQQGDISLESAGFSMYLRKIGVVSKEMYLADVVRGGICFEIHE